MTRDFALTVRLTASSFYHTSFSRSRSSTVWKYFSALS